MTSWLELLFFQFNLFYRRVKCRTEIFAKKTPGPDGTGVLSNNVINYALLCRLRTLAEAFLIPSMVSAMFCSVKRGCIGMLRLRL